MLKNINKVRLEYGLSTVEDIKDKTAFRLKSLFNLYNEMDLDIELNKYGEENN